MARTKRSARGQNKQQQVIVHPRQEPSSSANQQRLPPKHQQAGAVETLPKPVQGESKKKKRPRRYKKAKGVETSYVVPIYRVLRQIYNDQTISKRAMDVVNTFMNDIFERIAREAAILVKYNKHKTMTPLDIESATKLVLGGGELTKHAVHVGSSAVVRFFNKTFGINESQSDNQLSES
ncbi:histone H2B-like [Copidosoma floridanum]|uniref:histone H2B-like n=1 Tax=Copidosoma floridanum TaxID=29053 RepID=UPI0006C967EE|nr:histone H2B-like [Copidosoma floridanum]